MGYPGANDGNPVTLALLALFVVLAVLLGAVALWLLQALRRVRRSEEALRESEERFREVSHSAQDAVILLDARGCVTFWNAAAERLFGHSAEEAIGRDLHRWLAPSRFHHDYGQAFPRFATTGEGPVVGSTLELRALRKGGEEFPVELSLGSVRLSTGWCAIGVVRDITDRKAAEERERRLVTELQEKVEELDAFTWRVSHDLKAPLKSLRGWCDILADALDGTGDATVHDTLERVSRGARNMDALISRLLTLSQVGRDAVDRQPVRLADILDDVRNDLAAALKERGTRLGQADEDAVVLGDRALLGEVLTNLVGNALKFNDRQPPRVRVGVRALPGGERAVHVQDDGVGIPADDRERAFRPFQRVHGNGYEGFGAGLAICRRIVEAHGGRIWVEANDDRGSTFLFTLGPDGVRVPPPVRDERSSVHGSPASHQVG